MIFDITYLKYLLAEINKFQAMKLKECDFYEGGEKIDVPKNIIDDFVFTGLSNKDFIETDFYLTGFSDTEEKK